jgi:flagellar hook assembly protein FlgD
MSSVASIASASEIQLNYMKLLIEQLRHQNPLEPLNNEDMATQMAQFAQLQQLETMNSNFGTLNSTFAEVLESTNRSYAESLIGREISFFTKTEAGDLVQVSGTVKEVLNDPEGGILLAVQTSDDIYTLNLDGVVSVKS